MMTKRLFERLGGRTKADHAAWGYGQGNRAVVHQTWLELGWSHTRQITPGWGTGDFYADEDGTWFQFNQRADVSSPQPGDHPGVTVPPGYDTSIWAQGIEEIWIQFGHTTKIVQEGENCMLISESIPMTIEFLPKGEE